MATIYSLPTEILHRILHFAPPLPADLKEDPCAAYNFLLVVSLIWRPWRAEGQRLLRKRIWIWKNSQARSLVSKGGTGWTTTELVLGGSLSTKLALAVVELCSGVRSLALLNQEFAYSFLMEAQLAGASSPAALCPELTLGLPDVSSLALVLPPSSAYRHSFLTQDFHFLAHLDFGFTVANLTPFLQPFLTSLAFSTNSDEVLDHQIPALVKIAPQLFEFSLIDLGVDTTLEPFIAACVHLSHLSAESRVGALISRWLPNSLKKWTVLDLDIEEELEVLAEVLVEDVAGLKGLRKLVLGAYEEWFWGCKDSVVVLRECRKRGVEFSFAADEAGVDSSWVRSFSCGIRCLGANLALLCKIDS